MWTRDCEVRAENNIPPLPKLAADKIAQLSLSKGKAARSTKLWYLLKQALTGFQRGTDIAKFVELHQGGAAAGYELWRELDKELSVRSRVEGQALREQALLILDRAAKALEKAFGYFSAYDLGLFCSVPQARCKVP